MISRFDLDERVREWRLREDVVEKDYVLGWVLWGIGVDPVLSQYWAFKGGTCLKKCYLETYRFSEDLDFTVLPGGPILGDDLHPVLSRVLANVNAESGIDFSGRVPLLKTHKSGHYTEGRIYYTGPRGSPMVASIKLDLSSSEKVVRPTVLQPIVHSYPDELPAPATVRCYSFEEVFAEKIRAMGERGRPRDLYDIVNLYRRDDLANAPAAVKAALIDKCSTKGVPIPTYATVSAAVILEELETEWAQMLGHQLPALPPLKDFWAELPRLFQWLEGSISQPRLAPVAAGSPEDLNPSWTPPPMVSTWGGRVPLESVRFAAANRLCVNLGYQGSVRTIEPYSLRQTRAGNLLLYAVKAETGEPRAYRVDRIESVQITNRTFIPRYAIEFSLGGPLSAPPIARAAPSRQTRSVNRFRIGPVYIVECPFCSKKFRRSTHDLRLNQHKTPDGHRCSGSGRMGYLAIVE